MSYIHTLLIQLREHALTGSPAREFGDFVVHRVRDRGPFFTFMKDKRAQLENSSIREGQGATNDLLDRVLSQPGVYSQSDVLSSLNNTLQAAGFKALPNALAGDILVCIMSLLHGIRFEDKQKTEIGRFLFAISKTKVGLLGQILRPNGDIVMRTVLATDNHYHPFEPPTPDAIGVIANPGSAITLVRQAGVLRIKSM